MKKIVLLCFIVCISFANYMKAQNFQTFPPHWYKGMEDTILQLIIHQKDIRDAKINMPSDAIKILKRYPSSSIDYMMLDLSIPRNFLGNIIPIEFIIKKKKLLLKYELKEKPSSRKPILNQTDLIYLIMPDRFANGDVSNDLFDTMEEKTVNRKDPFGRHGGDLKGIENNLTYIQSVGFNTLWLTPFQENNEPEASYHGYAITDHYKTDPRFGTNNDYKNLSAAVHARGMKMVIDLVFNHIGDQHWMIKDMPFPNFIHRFDTFTRTNYRANTLLDPYASSYDKKIFTEGWFDKRMPDLNMKDPALARYMIQQTLWWMYYAEIDAIRIDTYTYPDQEFMKLWYQSIREEFPEMSIFGEIWEHAVPLQSYFAPKDKRYDQEMQNVLDFQFCFAMDEFVNQDFGWTEGVSKLYYSLSQDFLYKDPFHHVTFLDNHDLDRFLSQVNEDASKLKVALGMLLTMRGIPCIFYGTEVLMKGKGSHGIIREDFSGGWPGDAINKFDEKNRSKEENELINYISKIQNWKKNHPAFNEHKMIQFIPQDGIYAFARYSVSGSAVLIIYNSNKVAKNINTIRFQDILKNKTSGKNILNEKGIDLKDISMDSKELMIIDLK
jgi:glycosidase